MACDRPCIDEVGATVVIDFNKIEHNPFFAFDAAREFQQIDFLVPSGTADGAAFEPGRAFYPVQPVVCSMCRRRWVTSNAIGRVGSRSSGCRPGVQSLPSRSCESFG